MAAHLGGWKNLRMMNREFFVARTIGELVTPHG